MEKTKNYDLAYAEVVEVLNYIPVEEYKKIPKQFITFIEENMDENCSFKYNVALPFEKQNISDDAKNILGMIFRLFIISQDKKDELNLKDRKIREKEEQEKREKYNPDNLFKNAAKQNEINKQTMKTAVKETKENNYLPEKQEKWYQKLFNKIKKFFKR